MPRPRALVAAGAAGLGVLAAAFVALALRRAREEDLPRETPVREAAAARSPRPGGATGGGYAPPATRDPRLRSFVDKRAEGRIPDDFTSSVPRIVHPEDVAVVLAVLADASDADEVRNEAANLLRRSSCEALPDALAGILARPDESARFRGFCVQHLGVELRGARGPAREGIAGVLRGLLTDRDTTVRREALLALAAARDPAAAETAVGWLADEGESGLRDVAVRCVRELDLRDQLPTIRRLASSDDEAVRVAAIFTLGEWRDQTALSAIQVAEKSPSLRVRRAAVLALEKIRGVTGAAPGATPAGQTDGANVGEDRF